MKNNRMINRQDAQKPLILIQESVDVMLNYFERYYTILALFIYAVGFLYRIIYYWHFDINIIHYITISGILLSTLQDFIYVIVILTILIILGTILAHYLFLPILKKLAPKIIGWLKKIENESRVKRMALYFFYTSVGLFTLLTIGWFCGVFRGDQVVLLTIFSFFSPITILSTLETWKKTWVIMLMTILLFGVKATYDAEAIYRKGKIVSFIHNDKYFNTFQCSEYKFLGETSSTILLLSSTDKASIILNKSEINNYRIYTIDPLGNEK